MKKETYKTHINRDVLAKLFFDITEERYPSSEKLVQMASRIVDPMGGDEWESVHLKIIILTSMRDMIKAVAPTRLYRTLQHRDDLHLAVIEALEDLEDKLEEPEEAELAEQEKSPEEK